MPVYLPDPFGGYGGASYGFSSYGSADITPPRVTGASPIDGYRVEVFFSEEMRDDDAFRSPLNYAIASVLGVPLTSLLVVPGVAGERGGFTSAILTHSGSTLGGSYAISASGLRDLAGNLVVVGNYAFLAFGDQTQVLSSLLENDDGRTVKLDFRDSRGLAQDILPESEFSPGVESLASYELSTEYLIPATIESATQDPSDPARVFLDVSTMTATEYSLAVGPAEVYGYDGSVLPDEDSTLNGVEVGSGTSVASSEGLTLSKPLGVSYGWELGDLTGRLEDGSTFRADFSFNFGSATISPPVADSTLATLSVSDGSVQVDLALSAIGVVRVLNVSSGSYSAQVPVDWGSGPVTVTLLRNQRGGFYSVLFDSVPALSFPIPSADGIPTIASGTAFVLTPSHEVSLATLRGVEVSASSTIFTSSWNFLHDVPSAFVGSSLFANDRVRTRYGPLVRGWGDATPATVNDVEVRVNGTPVSLARVNPYLGEIFPTVPIPLTASGTVSVEVDYVWFANPTFGMAGLNTPGLTLNSWAAVRGRPSGVSSSPSGNVGAFRGGRFPMSVVLSPKTRPSPLQVGKRYLGLQKDYSALLNSPTTLRLNKNPNALADGKISASSLRASGAFDGTTAPPESATPWTLSGEDLGGVVGDGSYRVVDDSSGPYGVGLASVYARRLDLSLETSVNLSSRVRVESYVPDGVFTGVAFGIHDGGTLLLAGLLVVDGVHHVGVLLDGENPHLSSSWEIGPSAPAEGLSQSVVEIPFSSLPTGVGVGSRFRVASGPQSGVYEIAACGLELDATGTRVRLAIAPDLPENVSTFGNDSFTLAFETPWSEDLVSLRASTEFPEKGVTRVLVGGRVSGLVAELSELPPYPAQTALLLPALTKGVAFWGSVSRRAKSSSLWDFVRYDSNPKQLTQTVQGVVVDTALNVLPQDEVTNPWYLVGGFGKSAVDSSAERLLLKATSSSSDIPLEFFYSRVEPYLTPKVTTDLEARFRVESGILGGGDVEIRLRDGVREARLSPLLYVEGTFPFPGTGEPTTGRALVTDLPRTSLSGLQSPEDEGWEREAGNYLPAPFVRGQTLEFEKPASDSGIWVSPLLIDPQSVLYEGVIAEVSASVIRFENGTIGGVGFVFGAVVRGASWARTVVLTLSPSGVELTDSSLNVIATYPFNGLDATAHTYRLALDPGTDTVVLTADDTVLGSAPLSSFPTMASVAPYAFVGGVGDGSASFVVRSASLVPLRALARAGSSLGRTFGIRLSSEGSESIDAFRIPRSDGTAAPNSSLAAVPVLMDWTNYARVRLYLDPNWGVSLYRPDLPLPPWATGDFATDTTNPSAAWATVEYRALPSVSKTRGSVSFGSLDPRSISQSRWDYVRYRIRGDVSGFGLAPQGMVLNRVFSFHSGELNVDVTPEIATLYSRSRTLANVFDSAILASRVFSVQVDGEVLPSTSWGFDSESQNLVFNAPLPSLNHPVTVVFAPKKPVTKEYVCSQPFEASVTLLNEGTPAFPKSLSEPSTRIVEPTGNPEDSYEYVRFEDGPDSLYASVDYCETTRGESIPISTICDGPGPGLGLSELELDGRFTSDAFLLEGGPGGPWGRRSPVIRGSSSRLQSRGMLFVSGGRRVDGALNDSAIQTYPNARGPDWTPNVSGMGMNQDYLLSLTDVLPREESFLASSLFSDNVPPSFVSGSPNPDGTPGAFGNGSAVFLLEDFAGSLYSRLGPWGGLAPLSQRSLLSGGSPLLSSAFLLEGGSPLSEIVTVSSGTLAPTS